MYIRLDCVAEKEFLEFVFSIKQKVFRLAKRLLTSVEEAEDPWQEVLIKMWNKNGKLTSYKSIEAVMMTITKNYCLDRLKSKQASNLQLTHSDYLSREASLNQHIEDKKIILNKKKWLGLTSSILVLLEIGFALQPNDLETFDDPEIALKETQKALSLIAENLNKGKEKIYVLHEYESAKNKIFTN